MDSELRPVGAVPPRLVRGVRCPRALSVARGHLAGPAGYLQQVTLTLPVLRCQVTTCGTNPGGKTNRTSARAWYQAEAPLQPRETLPVMDLRQWFVKVLAATFVPLRYNATVTLKEGMACEHLILATEVMVLGRCADGLPILSPPVAPQEIVVLAGVMAVNAWLADKTPAAGVGAVDACAVVSDPAPRTAAIAAATTAALVNFIVPP